MAHTAQERYSSLVDEKLRNTLVTKDNLIFNNRYEGDPKAGKVKIPVRDTEVEVKSYNKQTGATISQGSTSYFDLDTDIDDADTAERYSSAVRILAEADEIRNKDIDYPSAIRQYCAVFRKFYDFLFGDGTSEKIFDGIKDNRRKYDAVYESLLDFIRTQRLESDNRLSRMVQRYTPKKAKK